MWQFVEFWWSNLREGAGLAFAAFGLIETVAGATWAVLAIRKKKFPEEKRARWEEWVKATAGWVFVVSFVVSTIFIAPFFQFKKAATDLGTATNNVAQLSERLLKRQKKEDEAKLTGPLKRLEESQKKTATATEGKVNIFIDSMMTNANPRRAALERLASGPAEIPKVERQGQGIDLNAVDKIAEAFNKKKQQESAKAALSRLDAETLDQATFDAAFPHIDYYVKEIFQTALREIAEQNGDRISSTYTNAASIPMGQASVIQMEKNPGWIFHIQIRRDSHGPGGFNWMIVNPNFSPYFKCAFSGTNYTFGFYDGPPGIGTGGSGQIASLTETNLSPALEHLIAFQTSAYPLSNLVAQPASK
jgi:hypothetical protein